MHEELALHQPTSDATLIRERLSVRGRVQGVGFRPFVYRLATQLGLAGRVGNDAHGAFIEVQGSAADLERFKARLRNELPPLARIEQLFAERMPSQPDAGFSIETSASDGTQDAEITPDMAMCDACRRELLDPADRRYRYAFINCTNCGPRYSIIHGVPYDRQNTTMVPFLMCAVCRAEYDDPTNRRFHAQPNACAACGPRLWMEESASAVGHPGPGEKSRTQDDPIRRCVKLLGQGKIVAIKGLGGFHLACRADLDEAVATLRFRKGRESKPLAVMVADLATACDLAVLDATAAAALTDVTRPIVLAPQQEDQQRAGRTPKLSRHVAPGTDMLGLMLPYTPLHELLFAEGLGPTVMTSGNPSEEPLCCDNEEALQRLSHIADAFLLHDRDIARRVDDSVVQAVGPMVEDAETRRHRNARTGPSEQTIAEQWVMPIRRARGFAPGPIRVPAVADVPVLAVGAELKSTVCVLAGHTAVVSEHLGELANAKAYRNFVATVDAFQQLLRVEPGVIAYDLHPDYAATRFALAYARERGVRAFGVQHHHAHMVSAMADNGISEPVVGIVCDGTGYGTDGAIWGCEVLVGDALNFERAGHLGYFSLPGGDAAARQTWRPGVSLLYAALGENWRAMAGPTIERLSEPQLEMAHARLHGSARLPLTSSLGRLFDAVAFLLGLSDENHHEAQAAMALETAARRTTAVPPLTYAIESGEDTPAQPLRLDVRPMIRELVEARRESGNCDALARSFHETLAAGLADMSVRVAGRRGVDRVVLSGGCFANRLLLGLLSQRLAAAGLQVFRHRQVPTGDGGVSLGQAVCTASRIGRSACV